jgi:hypothetical protein
MVTLMDDSKASTTNVVKILDKPITTSTKAFPKKFRTSNDSLKPKSEITIMAANDNEFQSAGLADLHLSASGQYTIYELEFALKSILNNPLNVGIKTIYIIDLRQEYHGFINGLPFSYFAPHNAINASENKNLILAKEKQLIYDLNNSDIPVELLEVQKKTKEGEIDIANSISLMPRNLQTEEEIVKELNDSFIKQYGVNILYQRFYVLDHHKPDDEEVDSFLKFAKKINPSYIWLHFHCKGGIGRTTIFSIMYDILHNANTLSVDEIIFRHYLLSGVDINTRNIDSEIEWLAKAAADRKEFIHKFYNYVKASDGYTHGTTWSKWITNQIN